MASCSQDELLREEDVQTKSLLSQDDASAVDVRMLQRIAPFGAFAALGFLALAAGHQLLSGAPATGAQSRGGA